MVFYGLSDEGTPTLTDFREHFDIDMPLLFDKDRQAFSQYQNTMAFPTAAYPQTYVVDKEGTLIYYNNIHDIEELRLVLEGAVAE